MKDTIFNQPGAGKAPFEFNAQVAGVFDDMVSRSVPFYSEVLRMSSELACEFYQKESMIYDLGCSTGALAKYLAQQMSAPTFHYTGVDTSPEMLVEAQKHTSPPGVKFVQADIGGMTFSNASVFVANYTFQFLKPMARRALLRKIYAALKPNGCLIVSEKCLEDSADVSRLFADRYHALKERNGYSKLEIAEKREALENVLIPFRVQENIEMLSEAGFSPVSIFFKCYNFVSFLAIKS